MSDPVVCSFLTKTLCAQGGRLGLTELREHIDLSEQQLVETLQAAGPRRFLLTGDDGLPAEVLAVSDVRVCVLKECQGCDRLHLCKLHLRGKCNLGPSTPGQYSHDISSAENKKVLKTHELSGLSEDELRVLLLQNDPFFLPDVCQFYNRRDGVCNQKNNCSRLHICRHYLQGKCKFFVCKRSHKLLDEHPRRVLETAGIDAKIVSNFQIIYDHKHVEFNKEQNKEKSKLKCQTACRGPCVCPVWGAIGNSSGPIASFLGGRGSCVSVIFSLSPRNGYSFSSRAVILIHILVCE
uniref:C3H1-type domain-containing protein n=1 Tax=Anser brachyrhynchus TaxID=132585 RepID=A0A8B9CM66_9AVES